MPRELRPVSIPARGVANASAYIDNPADFCPSGSMLNWRNYEPGKKRPRGGKRPGTVELIQLPNVSGAVKAMATVTLASQITGYRPGTCVDMGTGRSREALAPAGNIFVLDSAPSTIDLLYMDLTATGYNDGPSGNAVHACAWSLDGSFFAVASNYTDSGTTKTVTRVSCYARGSNVALWSVKLNGSTLGTAGLDVFNNTLCFSTNYLWVTLNERVVQLNPLTGAVVTTLNMGGWSDEAVEVSVGVYNGVEYLFVGFIGTGVAGTTAAGGAIGTVGVNTWQGRHFRSGVMKFSLADDTIAQTAYGPTYTSPVTDDGTHGVYNEGSSSVGYWRASLQSNAYPYGCLISAMRAGPDGEVVFTRPNQGWGPRASFTPGNRADITICKIDPDGTLAWEGDITGGSVHETVSFGADGSYECDIHPPGAATDYPTLQAVAIDGNGDVYVAGRQTPAGFNLFKFNGLTGQEMWRTTVTDVATQTVYQSAIAIDPTDGNIVVGLHRNDVWTVTPGGAASATMAQLLKVNAGTGNVMWSFDLGSANKHTYGVAVNVHGEILYTGVKI